MRKCFIEEKEYKNIEKIFYKNNFLWLPLIVFAFSFLHFTLNLILIYCLEDDEKNFKMCYRRPRHLQININMKFIEICFYQRWMCTIWQIQTCFAEKTHKASNFNLLEIPRFHKKKSTWLVISIYARHFCRKWSFILIIWKWD